jgi:hypothetical protein
MRKVNLFNTVFVALLLSVFCLSSAQAKVVKDPDKGVGSWSQMSGKKYKMPKGLQILSFEQVAKLNHQKRTQYIGLIRKAALDLDKIQRSFKGLHVVALDNSFQKNEDLFAYSEALEILFGKEAYAQDSDRNKCIYALNESSYPADQVKDGRAPFQCILVECNYGKTIKGVRCGWTASGLINKADVGCLPIEKATNAIDRTHASKACWDQRSRLAQENKSEVNSLIADSNKFYGFPSGTISADACTSDRSGQFMNDLIRRAYSNEAYSQLVKVAYFCQARGGGMPKGLINYDGVSEALTFKKLEGDWSGLNTVAKDIFASLERHCTTPLSSSVVSDIEKGVNLKKVAKGSSAYEMELQRQEYLKQAREKNQTPTSLNVLEVEECRHANLAFDELNNQLKDISGTFPRVGDGTPPDVPPGPTNDEIVDVEPSGCSENVGKDESNLAQAAARCMPCLIQSHEAKKTGRGDYSPSKKFLSLMSTLALACGDGQANDTTVNPQLMMDYWMAFGHCSNQTYEWRGTEDKALVAAWGEKSGRPFWKKGKDSKDASTHPDRGDSFSKAYGLSLDTAKKLFCDPSGKKYDYSASASEKARFLKARRQQFNQEKKVLERGQENSIADNLMACMNEASKNAEQFHQGSNMCYGFVNANDTASPAFQSAQNDWLSNGYPTIVNRGGACFIAKQIERYKVGCNGADICYDKNRDGKDDKSGCTCGGTATYMVYVNPGFNDKQYRVRVEARENGQLVPDINRRPNQPSADAESIAYLDAKSCPISAADAKRVSQPAGSSR